MILNCAETCASRLLLCVAENPSTAPKPSQYYYHFDDQFFLLFPAKGTGLEHADALFRNCRAEFEAQYRRGRQFAMVLHPHAIGFPHRLRMLDGFLAHLGGFPGVWAATGSECAAHWSARYPADSHLRLVPSIWQDHPDSLS
jgi:hypothetical protein